jgi:hypothetical protein
MRSLRLTSEGTETCPRFVTLVRIAHLYKVNEHLTSKLGFCHAGG